MAKTTIEVDLVIKGSDSVSQVEQKTKSLRSQLFQLKELLASGTLDKGQFTELSLKAAKLQDAIGDVNKEVRLLSSDAQKLDTIVSITQGIVGGFAAVQGITALVGDENEDLQKTMVKLQGAMAALNGLQAVAATLNKSSAASTTLMTFAQARYTAVVGTTTGALKLLRIAGAALGIGLIVSAIALLVANFDDLKKLFSRLFPQFDILISLFKTLYNAVTDFFGITSDATRAYDKLEESTQKYIVASEREIELMKARGATAKEIWAIERSIIDAKLKLLNEQVKINGKLNDKQLEEAEQLQHDKRILDAVYFKQKEDDTKKLGAERKKERENEQKDEAAKLKKFKENAGKQANEGFKRGAELRKQQSAQQREYDEIEEEYKDALLLKQIADDEAFLKKRDEDQKAADALLLEQTAQAAVMKNQIVADSFKTLAAAGEIALGQQFKNTAAGKVLALSEIATQTALAFVSGLRIAQKSAEGTGPAAAIAFPAFYASQAVAILGVVAKAKAMLGGGGGGSAPSISGASVGNSQPPPIQGFIPQQRQDVKGSQRVYVLEKDITDTQGRVARIRTNATLM